MLSDKLRAIVDQNKAFVVESFPPLWRQLFLRCVEVGFSESESLELVKIYILSFNPHGSRA